MKPTEHMERSLTWHKDRPIYVHRHRSSNGERYIRIVVHHPKGRRTEQLEFHERDYGDNYEEAARHLLELLEAACDHQCKIPEAA